MVDNIITFFNGEITEAYIRFEDSVIDKIKLDFVFNFLSEHLPPRYWCKYTGYNEIVIVFPKRVHCDQVGLIIDNLLKGYDSLYKGLEIMRNV